MNSKFVQAIRAAVLIPVAALSLVAASQAQTAKPMAPAASMPMDHMQKGAAGSDDMKQSMTDGKEHAEDADPSEVGTGKSPRFW